MLYRIIGGVLVLLVVGALYVITEGAPTSNNATVEQSSPQPTSDDTDFKNLKIN